MPKQHDTFTAGRELRSVDEHTDLAIAISRVVAQENSDADILAGQKRATVDLVLRGLRGGCLVSHAEKVRGALLASAVGSLGLTRYQSGQDLFVVRRR